jgi:hypothetical protein
MEYQFKLFLISLYNLEIMIDKNKLIKPYLFFKKNKFIFFKFINKDIDNLINDFINDDNNINKKFLLKILKLNKKITLNNLKIIYKNKIKNKFKKMIIKYNNL